MKIEIVSAPHGLSCKASIFRGTPKSDPPKTWKKVCNAHHNMGRAFNTDFMSIYKTKNGEFRYEIYRDGCIYPYYGRIKFDDETVAKLNEILRKEVVQDVYMDIIKNNLFIKNLMEEKNYGYIIGESS